MLTAALTVAAAVCAVAVIFAWSLGRAGALPAPAFNEHAAAACALLQPDHPTLPDEGTPFADEIEGWLATRTPTIRPAAPDMEDPL